MLLLCGRKYGHMKFQDYDHVQINMMYRSYSQIICRATTDCVCYALDRDTFRKIMMQQGKSDMGRRVALLGKVRIFYLSLIFRDRAFVSGNVPLPLSSPACRGIFLLNMDHEHGVGCT